MHKRLLKNPSNDLLCQDASVFGYDTGMAEKRSLGMRAFLGAGFFGAVLAAAVCLSAWSFEFWEGWIFLAVFLASNAGITVYFLKKDPALIERRMKRGPRDEKQKSQKLIQRLIIIAFVALVLFPGFDHRFGWSRLPVWAVAAGDALVALGMMLVFFVFQENSFAASVIQVDAGQSVVSSGPYQYVRHPMYSGVLVTMLGVPLALGSLWGMLLYIPMVPLIIWRLTDEEKFLRKNLTGYEEYRMKTRYRLVPGAF